MGIIIALICALAPVSGGGLVSPLPPADPPAIIDTDTYAQITDNGVYYQLREYWSIEGISSECQSAIMAESLSYGVDPNYALALGILLTDGYAQYVGKPLATSGQKGYGFYCVTPAMIEGYIYSVGTEYTLRWGYDKNNGYIQNVQTVLNPLGKSARELLKIIESGTLYDSQAAVFEIVSIRVGIWLISHSYYKYNLSKTEKEVLNEIVSYVELNALWSRANIVGLD